MRRWLIPAVIFTIVALVVPIAIGFSLGDISLTAQERDQVAQACAGCHDENELASVRIHKAHKETPCFSCHDSTHSIHANADCQDCHAGTTGLKTASQAYDVLRWAGIGAAGLLVIFLVINLFIVRLRVSTKEKDNG